MKLLWTAGLALVSLLVFLGPRAEASAANRVTILYDGFGKPSDLRKDWGFAALISVGQRPGAGCSHPGIEPILEEASDAEIQATVSSLLDTWRIQELAPGHCSGERTFALLRARLGQRHVYAGVGTTIPL